ncbi:MAG TPA: hypothetical protein VM123_03090 [archaeon]|nr:hypothetical protein [archaeon]
MRENRSQDIQLIKLAIQVEKDGLHFLDRFVEKSGGNALAAFFQQFKEEAQANLESFEDLLGSLESAQSTENIEEISLDDYVKELQKTRSEKFYPASKVSELFDRFFNPIRILAYYASTLDELADFYSSSASNIFYEKEKKVFLSVASRKKDQSDDLNKKKREIISRFP